MVSTGRPASFTKLLISDPPRSRRLYEALGFELRHADPVFTHLRWAEGAELYLVATPPGRGLEGPHGAGVLVCFSILARREPPTLESLAQAAEAVGATVDGPRDAPWDTRELVVVDPDGYRINFVE
jgi:lactoylglutathione lyase